MNKIANNKSNSHLGWRPINAHHNDIRPLVIKFRDNNFFEFAPNIINIDFLGERVQGNDFVNFLCIAAHFNNLIVVMGAVSLQFIWHQSSKELL